MSFVSSIPLWGWIDILANIIVLVALCGESHWALKRLIPSNSIGKTSVKWRREKLKKNFEFLLILGIAGEVGCLPLSIKESADSNLAAKQAERDAGEANEHAALVESNNLILRTNVLELEAKIRWRAIMPEQKDAFMGLTKGILKFPIRVRMAPGSTTETQSYAQQIRVLLDSAGFVETNADLAICEWPPSMNVLWNGTGTMPSVIFFNNFDTFTKYVDLQNAKDQLKAYPSYATNASVRTEFSVNYGGDAPKAYVTDDRGTPILHIVFHETGPFQMNALMAVQSAFSAIGIQSTWMTWTNIPLGCSEIFVNQK